MIDAESTIRHAILHGYVSATGKPNEAEERVDAIFHSLFKPDVQWAVGEYLKEIE